VSIAEPFLFLRCKYLEKMACVLSPLCYSFWPPSQTAPGIKSPPELLSRLLYAVSASDPITFVPVALLLLAVGLRASYISARRATRIDSVVALRSE
jgi:ABC-type lipoprotein release transport system permease subunit